MSSFGVAQFNLIYSRHASQCRKQIKKKGETASSSCAQMVKYNVIIIIRAHGVGRVVGALGSEAGFAGSMLN